jgi:hypothetical protein
MGKDTKFITVYTAYGEPDAHIIKGKLETEGIPVILKYESAGLVFGIITDGLGQIQIQVPEDMVDVAKKSIETTE